MKHYTNYAWEEYVKGRIEKPQSTLMEDHLAFCEVCTNKYVKALESSGSIFDTPPGLADKIMAAIQPLQPQAEKTSVSSRKNRRLIITRYAVAALLALVLWQSGFFITFGRKLSSSQMQTQLAVKLNENIDEGFGDRMVGQVNYFFDFLTVKRKEWFHENQK